MFWGSFPVDFAPLAACLYPALDARSQLRLPVLVTGMLLAQGRKTVAAWLRGAGVGLDFRRYYYLLGAIGRRVERLARSVLYAILERLDLGERVLLAVDDSPTRRAGPCVEGAGIHHDPSPGPADRKFLYGHVWVTLALVVRHPCWGAIALPLLAYLYIRAKDLKKIRYGNRPPFQTKLELAAKLVRWVVGILQWTGKDVWVVVDGGYAKRPFLRACAEQGVTVVGRLRRDAALWSAPENRPPGERRRGRPRIYGTDRLSLVKRAGQGRGWQTVEVEVYGKKQTKRIKTFLATWKPAGGRIRVVIVKEEHTWLPFFCTDPEASVEEILMAVADRGAEEQVFHDVKEVEGAGEQQVRHLFANVAAWNLCLWLYTLVELWAWDKPKEEICDRSASPWDTPERRPSHADRFRALRRACLREELSRLPLPRRGARKIKQALESLITLAA